ncbi:MAG: histidine kinase [Bacteroidota bacterium]
METKRTYLRLLPHLLFWGGLLLIFYFQNEDSSWEANQNGVIILAIAIGVTYFNLYVVMPRFLLKKQYVLYVLGLSLTLLVGAMLLTWLIPDLRQIGNIPVFVQQIINLFMMVLLTGGAQLGYKYFANQLRLREIENKQLKTELSLLKSQIHPHFLFNTLNNLYGLINQQENDRAAEVTVRLSALMRYLLETSKADLVSLNKEIQFLRDYMELEKIRIPDHAIVQFTVSPMHHDVLVPPLLFIPMMENAFKHGVGPHVPKPEVRFLLSLQGNDVFFESVNTLGSGAVSQPEASGMGLANLRKRLDILFPQEYILETDITDTHYKIRLNFSV